jgi:hypothetical protein
MHSVLHLQVRAAPVQMGVDRGAQPDHVVPVDEVEPADWVMFLGLFGAAEDRVPAGREVDSVVGQIPSLAAWTASA